jgi:hypothetical protein
VYTVPLGIQFVAVSAIGGAGAAETYDAAGGGSGAALKTTLAVTSGEALDVAVGTSATASPGGLSAGSASGGAGSDFIPPTTTTSLHSGGGGGASFVTDAGTVLVAAGAGGGAGAAAPGGSAATATSTSFTAGSVASGADGVTADPTVGGHGGSGGSSVPGAGGADVTGYGAGPGLDGVGEVGGNSFTNGGASVGAGGGGGGYAGGGGGGGGGYAGGGGAGSSYSIRGYSLVATSAAPSVTITEVTAPVFSSSDHTTFKVGQASSFLICAPAADDPAFSISGTLPAGIHLVDNGNGSASLTGTPTGILGTYVVTLTATGLGGAASQQFTLTIAAASSLPVTGVDAAPVGLLALLLMVVGATALVFRARRSAWHASR